LAVAAALDTGLGETERSWCALLSGLVVSIGAADLKCIICAAANVSDGALLVTRNQSLAITAALDVSLGEAERSLGALLGRLPVTVSAASLEDIVGAATNVSDRALVVIAKLGTAIYTLRDHVVDETLCSLGALLGRNPRAILTANLDSVVDTLLSVDGRAMVLVTLDSRDTIACAFGDEVS
jgi:hypothetical protein